jgi:hypothetical protein
MYQCTIDLLFDWFGISCMTTDIFYFYVQNRLIETSQTGGQQYNDTPPFSIPCSSLLGIFVSYGRWFYNVGPCRRRVLFPPFPTWHQMFVAQLTFIKWRGKKCKKIINWIFDLRQIAKNLFFRHFLPLCWQRQRDSNPRPWENEASGLSLFSTRCSPLKWEQLFAKCVYWMIMNIGHDRVTYSKEDCGERAR